MTWEEPGEPKPEQPPTRVRLGREQCIPMLGNTNDMGTQHQLSLLSLSLYGTPHSGGPLGIPIILQEPLPNPLQPAIQVSGAAPIHEHSAPFVHT